MEGFVRVVRVLSDEVRAGVARREIESCSYGA